MTKNNLIRLAIKGLIVIGLITSLAWGFAMLAAADYVGHSSSVHNSNMFWALVFLVPVPICLIAGLHKLQK